MAVRSSEQFGVLRLRYLVFGLARCLFRCPDPVAKGPWNAQPHAKKTSHPGPHTPKAQSCLSDALAALINGGRGVRQRLNLCRKGATSVGVRSRGACQNDALASLN